jgi:hypothetical protein
VKKLCEGMGADERKVVEQAGPEAKYIKSYLENIFEVKRIKI